MSEQSPHQSTREEQLRQDPWRLGIFYTKNERPPGSMGYQEVPHMRPYRRLAHIASQGLRRQLQREREAR